MGLKELVIHGNAFPDLTLAIPMKETNTELLVLIRLVIVSVLARHDGRIELPLSYSRDALISSREYVK